jgi:Fe2+ or Zn2+ uptake regulation protein
MSEPLDKPVEVDEHLRQVLEQSGWRCTRQRTAVHDYLRAVETHPTAEEVFAAVRHQIPNISLATVYKALEALVDAGLAAKVAGSDGPTRYDARTEAHYHVRCLKSGRIADLPTRFDPELLGKLDPSMMEDLRRQGFQVTTYRLEVVGYFDSAKSPTAAGD